MFLGKILRGGKTYVLGSMTKIEGLDTPTFPDIRYSSQPSASRQKGSRGHVPGTIVPSRRALLFLYALIFFPSIKTWTILFCEFSVTMDCGRWKFQFKILQQFKKRLLLFLCSCIFGFS